MSEARRTKRIVAWPHWHRTIAVGGCLIVAVVCVASGWDIWRARKLALAANDRELASLASALTEQTSRSLQEIELVLRRTAMWQQNAQKALNAGMTPADATTFLRQQIDDVPQIRELKIIDAAGDRLATSTLPLPPNISVARRRYFEELKQAAGDALAISEPMLSLIDGKPTFAVARRLEDANGRFKGAVVALAEDNYFRQFYAKIDLGPGTSIRLLQLAGAPVVAFERQSDIPTLGHVRSAIHAVTGYPLKIEVARDESVVLADWRSTSIDALIRTGSILAFVALLAFALVRQVRRLEDVNARLRASEQRWRPVFENAPVGIMVLPPGGHYLAANPAFQRMVGYSLTELMQLGARDITHPDDIEEMESRVAELLRGERDSVRFEKRYLHRDGHVVWTDMSIARAFGSQQSPHHTSRQLEGVLIATVEDMTQQRKAEQDRRQLESQLRQSQKLEALGTFAGGIAHDFNNILGAILGYGERALRTLPADTPEHRYVEQVMNAGNRARLLVERILAFSRSGMTARVPFRLSPVVEETIELLKARLPIAIRLDVRLAAQDAYVAGDTTHVHQVVMNLCSNAVLAMPEGGTLGISLVREHFDEPVSLSHGAVGQGDFVRLTVSDNGVGIAPDLLERIFNPFFTTRKAGEGTGLGLSLVDGIVREYGGGVHVHSIVGEGTRFDVYFPVTEALPHAPDRDGGDLPRGNGQTVLLVDDEDALVTLIEEELAELGYEPLGFRSSSAAWQAFRENPQRFDAVITDQTMPELTGLELTIRIRERRADIPVILCSGYSNAALEREAQAAGVFTVLKKPLRQADLARVLSRVLQK